jgi:hypothetical protein
MMVTSPFRNQVKIKADINAQLTHTITICTPSFKGFHCQESYNEGKSPCVVLLNTPNRCQVNLFDYNTGDLILDQVLNAGDNTANILLHPSYSRNKKYKICVGDSSKNITSDCLEADFNNRIDTKLIDGSGSTTVPVENDPVSSNHVSMGPAGIIFIVLIVLIGSIIVAIITYKLYCFLKPKPVETKPQESYII